MGMEGRASSLFDILRRFFWFQSCYVVIHVCNLMLVVPLSPLLIMNESSITRTVPICMHPCLTISRILTSLASTTKTRT